MNQIILNHINKTNRELVGVMKYCRWTAPSREWLSNNHWKRRGVIMQTLSSLVASQAVITITCSTASDDKIGMSLRTSQNMQTVQACCGGYGTVKIHLSIYPLRWLSVSDCSISITLAVEILQSCTKPSTCIVAIIRLYQCPVKQPWWIWLDIFRKSTMKWMYYMYIYIYLAHWNLILSRQIQSHDNHPSSGWRFQDHSCFTYQYM